MNCKKCGGKGYWEDAIGPLLCGEWKEIRKDGKLVDMVFVQSDHAAFPKKESTTMVTDEIKWRRFLCELGDGLAVHRAVEANPTGYEPVTVVCPVCEEEKTVTPATHSWPRCDDCDEPMQRLGDGTPAQPKKG